MGGRTGPRVFLSASHHPRANRVALHIVNCRPKMFIVENTGEEPPLPEMTAEAMLQIEAKRVGGVCISQRAAQRIRFFWDQNKMNMVAHQAVGPDFGSIFGGVFSEKGKVVLAVFGLEKDIHTAGFRAG